MEAIKNYFGYCRYYTADILAGIIVGFVLIVRSISLVSLIFTGTLKAYLPIGIGLSLLSAILLTLISIVLGKMRVKVLGLQSTYAIIVAVATSKAIFAFIHGHYTGSPLPTIIAIMGVASLSMGVSMWLLGKYRIVNIIRFLPYPVTSGFFAGIGWLFVIGGFKIVTNVSLTFHNLHLLFEPQLFTKVIFSIIYAFIIFIITRKVKHFLTLPILFISAFVIFYCYIFIAGISITEAGKMGLLMGPFSSGSFLKFSAMYNISQIHWELVRNQFMDFLVIATFPIISLAMVINCLEIINKYDIDINEETKVAGIANIVAGLFGSVGGYHQLGLSVIAKKINTKTILMPVVVVLVCVSMLFLGDNIIANLPKIVFGSVLFYLGIEFLYTELIDALKKVSKLDYVITVMILGMIANMGLLKGIGAGVIISVIIFMFQYSKQTPVRYSFTGSFLRSNVKYGIADNKILQAYGSNILIIAIQGYLFFGNIKYILKELDQFITDKKELSINEGYVILDFSSMVGMDSSAMNGIAKIAIKCEAKRLRLIFSALNEKLYLSLLKVALNFVQKEKITQFENIDFALEWCEEKLLKKYSSQTISNKELNIIKETFPQINDPRLFFKYLTLKEYQAGDIIFKQGDSANDMGIVMSGKLEIILSSSVGKQMRLRKIGAGAIIGEIGMCLGATRTASVIATQPTKIYFINKQDLAEIHQTIPELEAAIYLSMVNMLAERLKATDQLIKKLNL